VTLTLQNKVPIDYAYYEGSEVDILYLPICIHTYIHKLIHTLIHTYIQVEVRCFEYEEQPYHVFHTCDSGYIANLTCPAKVIGTYIHIYIHMSVCMYIHTLIHIHKYTHTYTHTHIHTYTQAKGTYNLTCPSMQRTPQCTFYDGSDYTPKTLCSVTNYTSTTTTCYCDCYSASRRLTSSSLTEYSASFTEVATDFGTTFASAPSLTGTEMYIIVYSILS
jgi:hypothetical protein